MASWTEGAWEHDMGGGFVIREPDARSPFPDSYFVGRYDANNHLHEIGYRDCSDAAERLVEECQEEANDAETD